MRAYWMIAVAGCLAVGCAHTVNYKLVPQDHWAGSMVDKVVRVEVFQDQTVAVTNKVFKDGDYEYRTNYRDRYANHELASGVTAMVVKHLQQSGLFRNVVPASASVPADYDLSATIGEYYAQGRVNKGAEGALIGGAAGGGLIGALLMSGATAGQKTDIKATVSLRDVTLREVGSTNVLWHDSVTVTTNFTAHFSAADEPVVFDHADNCLKQAVAELIQNLARALTTRTP